MDLMLSLTMVAAVALIAGAIFLARRGGARRQAWLMAIMALVLVANVLIWAIPVGGDAAQPAAAAGAR